MLLEITTGGSRLSRIFWEHEILYGLSVIRLIYIKLYKEKEKKYLAKKIRTKQESGLTTVQLKRDPPVYISEEILNIAS